MKLKYLQSAIIILLISAPSLFSQSTRKIPKFHIGIELSLGNTFPNFITDQEKWRATVYGSWSSTLSVNARFNKNWSGDLGIGLAGYAMVNRTDNDRYNLDFFSPYLISGLQYNHPIGAKRESFYGLSFGLQQGYKDEFTEVFNDYIVVASSKDLTYYFARVQMGIKDEFKNKKRNKPAISYEIGTYFRYNFNGLGKAEFIHNDNYVEVLKPKGHILGIYYKVLFPSSTTKVRIKTKQPFHQPTLYHPRMLS